ncbi:MATE family efflux transporter [Xiashengella succiniciproducens]|uniref:MATE family efflux transporter n=1 Tax=Xiashengella succiniciproducens TaxID=2949635 RepID=A0A9J6ZPE5_9BACT|nr:MATE family efflux transporter [Alkaliflexus sp. Ai-910]MDI9539201.1 MATE family efflux transporter [Bacteroidota bacterium]URW79507.1 MATE family efflux transporter [Alkaliflexus sp. Ai-910]
MNKEILRLAIPNVLTNITIPLLGMVDVYLMGHLESIHYLGGVALGSALFNFLYWAFAFLRMSISGLAAQSYGRVDNEEMAIVMQRGALIAAAGSLLLITFQMPLADLGLSILEGSPEVKDQARRYFAIRIWDAPASIMLFVFYGWYLGMQNSVYPMVIALTVNIVNIILSFVLVRLFGMDVDGVALGSVLAQYVGLILALILFFKKYRWIIPYFTRKLSILLTNMSNFLSVSTNIFIRTLFVILVFTFFTSKSAGIGDITLAANSVLLQYMLLFSYFLDGYGYAAEALIGKLFGARNRQKLSYSVHMLLRWGLGFAIVFSAAYLILGETLLSLFTRQTEIIETGKQYLLWVVMMPLVSFLTYIFDGVFIGIGGSVQMRRSVVIAAVFFFFLPFYILFPYLGNHAMWLSMFLFMVVRSLYLTISYPRIIKREFPHHR